jgi:thiopurine S-methyltransferase
VEHKFWHNKWDVNQIGFHLDYVHPLLKRNLELFKVSGVLKSGLKIRQEIFIPLCGKTLDIGYLLSQNYSIVAVELSEVAVQAVFQELSLPADDQPTISERAGGKLYQAKSLRVFVGDFFALTQADLGDVALVYDRAALVALPQAMRLDYAKHLAKITQYASQLLITLDYDQTVAGGPPFAVSNKEVEALYGETYPIKLIEEADIIEDEPRFKAKGLSAFYQRAYKLK